MSTPLEPHGIHGSPGSITSPTSNSIRHGDAAYPVSIGADISDIPNRFSDSSSSLGGGPDQVTQSFSSDTDQGRADGTNAVSRSNVTNAPHIPADLKFAQAGGDSFPAEMDVSIPEELVFTLPSGHPSIGVKPIDLLEMELYAVAPQCSEQFKMMAIYPIVSQVWSTYNLDSWASFMELDAKTCGDIALSFHQTIVRNPYFKNTVRAMVECDVTKEDFIWCYTVGLRLHTAIAGHLQSIGTLFDCIAKPIPWINIYLDPGVAEARNMFERHIAKGLPKLKQHSLGTTAMPPMNLDPNSSASKVTPTRSQPGADVDTPGSNAVSHTQVPSVASPAPSVYTGIPVPTQKVDTASITRENDDPNINASRYPDLLFPDEPPPHGTTHYHGRWNVDRGLRRFWEVYPNPIGKSQLPSNVSADNHHWYNRWHPHGKFVNYQGIAVSPTHRSHPDYLKHRPPPTVTFDPNITDAADSTTPSDLHATGTATIQHPLPSSAAPDHHTPSAVHPSVGIPNLIQPLMQGISRAVAQVPAFLRLTAPQTGGTQSQPFVNPTVHSTPIDPYQPARPIPQSSSHFTPGVNITTPGINTTTGVHSTNIGLAPGSGIPPRRFPAWFPPPGPGPGPSAPSHRGPGHGFHPRGFGGGGGGPPGGSGPPGGPGGGGHYPGGTPNPGGGGGGGGWWRVRSWAFWTSSRPTSQSMDRQAGQFCLQDSQQELQLHSVEGSHLHPHEGTWLGRTH